MATIFAYPPQPGLYWLKRKDAAVHIVEVHADGGVDFLGGENNHTVNPRDGMWYVTGEWIGPVMPPTEFVQEPFSDVYNNKCYSASRIFDTPLMSTLEATEYVYRKQRGRSNEKNTHE